jgi:hypothetical protein
VQYKFVCETATAARKKKLAVFTGETSAPGVVYQGYCRLQYGEHLGLLSGWYPPEKASPSRALRHPWTFGHYEPAPYALLDVCHIAGAAAVFFIADIGDPPPYTEEEVCQRSSGCACRCLGGDAGARSISGSLLTGG